MESFIKAAVATGQVSLWLLVAVAVVAAVWLLWRSSPVLTGRPCHAALFMASTMALCRLVQYPKSGHATHEQKRRLFPARRQSNVSHR